MKRATLALILGLLGFVLLVTSIALAAPDRPVISPASRTGPLFYYGLISDTDTYSPTTSTHPVASAIADYFEVEYSEIATLHAPLHEGEGLGFGSIVHAYFIAKTLGISPTDVIAEFQSGKGWGVIVKDYSKEYDMQLGLGGRGRNLGIIMSNRKRDIDSWMLPGELKKNQFEGGSFVPPGQLKKDEPDRDGFTPPGLLKKSGDDHDDGDDYGGPPFTPPGHAKDKGKGKDKK